MSNLALPDWTRPKSLYVTVCRPALPKDTPDVMELTRTIWDGEDYVPHVWADWLVDPEGLLAVAEHGPHVVGLGKLTRLAAGEWWLEGLRVHPQYEGQRIASHLHDYILRYWEEHGDGVIRLSTASFRKPVHHLCARTGFYQVADLTPYRAQSAPGSLDVFTPLDESDAGLAVGFAADCESVAMSAGLLEMGWQWASLTAERVIHAARLGRAWWWCQGRGLLLARDDEEEQVVFAQLIACPLADLAELLADFCSLAAYLAFPHVGWFAPPQADLQAMLDSAGYARVWDASVFVFEKVKS